tara:strand:- start:418 stop:684 length:267 start_codon:yes stop_codon:yes gene_type:complete
MSRKIPGDVVATMMLPTFKWAEFAEALDEATYVLDPLADDLHDRVMLEEDPEYAAELREEEATLGHVYEMIALLRDQIRTQTGVRSET